MTPSPSSGKRASGNPAAQARIELTVKQQREQQKREKLAEYQRQLARRRRSRLVWWIVGGTAGLAVIALVVASIVFAPKAAPTYTAHNSTGAQIEGIETFTNQTTHTDDPVDYPQSPPAGGPHANAWLNCGVYTQPVPAENAVHSQEHGAIWVTYDAAALSEDDVATLRSFLPSSYVILSPYEGLPTPIVLSAWNAQLTLEAPDDPRIAEFFTEYWRSQNVPEPTALCSSGIDAPGKQ